MNCNCFRILKIYCVGKCVKIQSNITLNKYDFKYYDKNLESQK